MNEIINTEEVNQIHELAKSPVNQIESGLSNFVSHTFEMIKEEDAFQAALQKEMLIRLPTLKNSELIAALTSETTNQNDMLSKVLAPTMQLLTAAQQAEMARQQAEVKRQELTISNTNIKEINQIAPHDVVVGMKALFELIQTAETKSNVIATTKE
jgi:hypothetical protein